MTNATTSDKCKVIKKALSKEYGRENVSVRKGGGTASGWVHVSITKETEDSKDNHNECQKAEAIANVAMKEAGYEFYTFNSDDGYDTQYTCLLVQVYAKNDWS